MITYRELLEEAWLAHRARRGPAAQTVVSTFAGLGGSSLGYSMAGYREVLAVEWDDKAVATFRRNFPEVPVHHGDIAALSVEEALEVTGLQEGELDVLDGSPPCQGFSTSGHREFDDPRNQLFQEYCRLLRGLRPRAFVMENVSGMVKGKMRLIFADILRALKGCGYQVSAKLLNAQWFNVPQHRPRMIFIGIREDLGLAPPFPVAERFPFTLRDALYEPLDHRVYGPPISNRTRGFWMQTGRGDAHEQRFNHYRAAWNRPVNSILRSTGSVGTFHPDVPRYLSAGELLRCASFPDGFELVGGFQQAVDGIGNCVPPLFMRAIATTLREALAGIEVAA